MLKLIWIVKLKIKQKNVWVNKQHKTPSGFYNSSMQKVQWKKPFSSICSMLIDYAWQLAIVILCFPDLITQMTLAVLWA